MPAVASSNWVISFKRDSLTDQSTYTITYGINTDEAFIKRAVAILKDQGYVQVRYDPRIIL